jgi:hypothetical protein
MYFAIFKGIRKKDKGGYKRSIGGIVFLSYFNNSITLCFLVYLPIDRKFGIFLCNQNKFFEGE